VARRARRIIAPGSRAMTRRTRVLTTFLDGRVLRGPLYSPDQDWSLGLQVCAEDRDWREADVSTEQSQTQEDPWLPGAHAHEGRTRRTGATPNQGPGAALGLIADPHRSLATSSDVPWVAPRLMATRAKVVRWGDVLRRADEFRRAMDEGSRLAGDRMVLYVLPRDQGIRVGFVTGRGLGGAVRRNAARRRLKNAWRSVAPRIQDGHDIVIVARHGVDDAPSRDVTAEMERLLEKRRVLRP